MATARLSTRSAGVRRLLQEAAELEQDECTDYQAAPLEDDLFQWHFSIRGPGAEFEGGVYHGRMVLPSEYPFKPPEIYMTTPSGRFETNKKICLSISSFHPETWQPSWGIRTALLALMAFFTTEAGGAVGSMDASEGERRRLAKASNTFQCATCGFDARTFPPLAAALPVESEADINVDVAEEEEEEGIIDVSPSPSPSPSPAPPPQQLAALPSPSADPHLRHDPPPPTFPPTPSPSSITAAAGPRPASARHLHQPLPAPATPGAPPTTGEMAHRPAAPVVLPPAAPPEVVVLGQPLALGQGGPPSWVDRTIVAVVLGLLALVVRKVA